MHIWKVFPKYKGCQYNVVEFLNKEQVRENCAEVHSLSKCTSNIAIYPPLCPQHPALHKGCW